MFIRTFIIAALVITGFAASYAQAEGFIRSDHEQGAVISVTNGAQVWVPGYWQVHGHHHVWVEGYWKQPVYRQEYYTQQYYTQQPYVQQYYRHQHYGHHGYRAKQRRDHIFH